MGVVLVVAVVTFGLCFLLDKAYTKTFRGKPQHKTGLSVRLNKRYALFGVILTLLGILAVVSGTTNGLVLVAGGVIILLVGIGLLVYYMTFGIFYDKESFVYTSFGKKSVTYRYQQIRAQQIYIVQGGNILVELHMTDGKTVHVQLQLKDADKFLDAAFAGWCAQRGIDPAACDFHDPDNSCWFPKVEEV